MKVNWTFSIFLGLTLATTALAVKLSCKQAKRPDGSLFFDCGHNVPKDDLKVRNSIIIWRTVTPEPPENAYLPPHPDKLKPSINLVRVDEPNYPNVSYNILTPFLIKPISPVTLKPSKPSVTTATSDSPSISENGGPSAIFDNILPSADPHKGSSTTVSKKPSRSDISEHTSSSGVINDAPLKRSKITIPEKRTEINPEQGANINQPDHLKSSHAMQRIETANLISVSSEIDQQTSGQQFPWTGCATSIWIFYLYFFLFIWM